MNTGEFILLVGIIISGFIIFSVVRLFIYQGAQQTIAERYKVEAREIADLISSLKEIQSSYIRLEKNISLCNLTVENGTLTYEKDGQTYIFDVPLSVKNVKLTNIASICIEKKDDKISLFQECPQTQP